MIEKSQCRASQGPLVDVIDLGMLPLSCFPLPTDPNPQTSPLVLALNKESSLVQLRHTVHPDLLYTQYWYFSGINQSMTLALQDIVAQALKRVHLTQGDIVLDIGCNDGTLLDFYPKNVIKVGIDPAKNITPKSCDYHINTYFSKEAYSAVMGQKKARIVTSIAMFYDLENPVGFALDVAQILHPEGLWIIELSYLPTMLQNISFDTICAEHLEYYSLQSIEYILHLCGLNVEEVTFNGVNGGSFRLFVRHKNKAIEQISVKQTHDRECSMSLCETETYSEFARTILKNKQDMLAFLNDQKARGKRVLGYGASTKGNTILAYYGIGRELIPFVADRNPLKWGRETVTRIPIISEDEARAMRPDYFLVLPYHFMPEFFMREREFRERGGKFISPVPKLTIL